MTRQLQTRARVLLFGKAKRSSSIVSSLESLDACTRSGKQTGTPEVCNALIYAARSSRIPKTSRRHFQIFPMKLVSRGELRIISAPKIAQFFLESPEMTRLQNVSPKLVKIVKIYTLRTTFENVNCILKCLKARKSFVESIKKNECFKKVSNCFETR